MTAEKINPVIKEDLFAIETQTVISAIQKIKNRGNKRYIPILFDILMAKPEIEVENEIKDLLATVKDKSAANSFIFAFRNKKYKSIWKLVLTTCWQNGLDFSNFTPIFIDLIIHEDWEIAFEAFTIIDNLEFLPNQEIINESVKKINTALKTADEQKSYLLNEILSILI
jgi:hypothetical protein